MGVCSCRRVEPMVLRAAMLLTAFVTVLSLQATPAQAQRVAWVPNPRTTHGGWVADPSHHLTPATVATLDQEIAALERETSAEIAVVVVDSTSGLTPFDFALAIHRVWGVGKSGKDNGLVFLWVPTQRAIFISVGPGLQGVLPDRRTGRIRDEQIFPPFKRRAFDEGVLAGVRALAAAAREETAPRQGITRRLQTADGGAGARPAASPRSAEEAGAGVVHVLWAILALMGGSIAAAFGLRSFRRRRPRACPRCRARMLRLDEKTEDEFLDKGEQAEERVKSVDYDVWRCPQCGETLKIPYRRRWTRTSECLQCRRITVRTTAKTIRNATTVTEGLRHVARHCENCGWHAESDEVIPVVVASSSGGSSGGGDSGGGGSDFGGGSSDGGGAGGSY
jgi:uncharacterized protein